MRKKFIVALMIGMWISLVATNVADAQTNPRVVIRIPFAFIVSGQTLPEGTYVLERIDQTKPNVVMLKNAGNKMIRLLFSQRVERWHAISESCVVFTRRGQQLHLTQIWTKGNPNGQQIPLVDEQGGRDTRGSDVSVQIKLKPR